MMLKWGIKMAEYFTVVNYSQVGNGEVQKVFLGIRVYLTVVLEYNTKMI